ncbi:hypothetical protein [Bradyrhizobium sp. STM 3557]|uniref:hypothetical protein n=1 Tax=Bradyrhizobium sp. STM 3557 TaxID=578920 RepID=UPI00388D19B5
MTLALHDPALLPSRLGAGSTALAWSRLSRVTLSLWAVLFAAELIASFVLCGGRIVFTLDDPYIHLAVADHILHGGYGVNATEYSSPSSSIIWPYLLALTEALHLGALGPLIIASAAAAATMVAVLRLIESFGLSDDDVPFGYAVAILSIFVASTIALPMTGLEHSLHVWATITTFAGLVAAARGRAPTWLHLVALVLLPLIRFEGAALALAAIAAFTLLGDRRFALAAAALIVLSLSAYVALMSARGLPLLPSSVLLKSRIAETAYEHSSAFGALLQNLLAALDDTYGRTLALLFIAIAGSAWWLRSDRRALIVCGAVEAAIGGHLAFGQYNWFHRYEVYVTALAALTLLWIATEVRPQLGARAWGMTKIALILLMALVAQPYLSAALITPFGARNIYEQQYQMGRFAREFCPHPVAVNDLGLVAYRNPNFVLDLWGLGSEQVRKAKLAGQYGPERMGELASAYDVGVAMIYDNWFPQGVPATWTKVAVLHTNLVTAAGADVAFYRTPSADAAEVTRVLEAFAKALPPRDRLEMLAR